MKKSVLTAVLLALAVAGFAFDMNGFELNIDLETKAFELRQEEKSDVDQRRGAGNFKPLTLAGPFGGHNFTTDTNMYLTYTGANFGGTFGLYTADDFVVKTPTLRGWIMPFGKWFKATMGLDIGNDYADSLDADPGMRIYAGVRQQDWDAYRRVDDITQDVGVRLESFFGPVTAAMAGRYFDPTVFPIALDREKTNTRFKYVNESKFSYGARLGSLIGEWGKVNASYIVEYSNYASDRQDYYGVDKDNEVVPQRADTEIVNHLFGAYASLTPLKDFGVSLGYEGIVTKYLDEFYMGSAWHKTTLPLVYKQAFNLNLRYKGITRWTFRTDNNLSFWTDKNYLIFAIPIDDMGIIAESQGSAYSDVNHFLLWNGLGVKYEFTGAVRAELYVRNLLRRDAAFDDAREEEFRFTRDKIVGELKCIWSPSPILEAQVGLALENEITTISKDVNQRNTSSNSGFVNPDNTPGIAKETVDSVFTFKIPVKIIIKMR